MSFVLVGIFLENDRNSYPCITENLKWEHDQLLKNLVHWAAVHVFWIATYKAVSLKYYCGGKEATQLFNG